MVKAKTIMVKIGIAEFEKLVKECLENPDYYASKTIVLWNAEGTPLSIAPRVIEQCCVDYNKKNSDRQVWYSWSDLNFNSDDITNIEVYCLRKDMYGSKTRGVLFNTGYCLPKELSEWLGFINSHENDKGRLSNAWVLIACAQGDLLDLNQNQFSNNCIIYSIEPTVAEWAEWAAQFYSLAVIDPIREFIEAKHPNVSFDKWMVIMNELELKLSLKQIPEQSFLRIVKGFLPKSTIPEDLWDFIQS